MQNRATDEMYSDPVSFLCIFLRLHRCRQAELAEKSARLKELNILLDMDQQDKTLLDEAPEEDSPDKEKSRSVER